jgi:DNA-binding beta-propeller fold protein YncE
VFDYYGNFRRKFGSPGQDDGQFNRPAGIALDAAGHVFVADSGNHRVQVFALNGEFLEAFGQHGMGDGQFQRPIAIGVFAGNIYVLDYLNNRVQVWT